MKGNAQPVKEIGGYSLGMYLEEFRENFGGWHL